MNLNLLLKCGFILIIMVIAVQARHYCEYYPLSRRCVGAFASGGKRSAYPENELHSFENYMRSKRILNELKKQELRDLMDYFDLENESSDLIESDSYSNKPAEEKMVPKNELKSNEEMSLLKNLVRNFKRNQ